jgi:hypothetical protein
MLRGELPKRYPASGINDPIPVGGKSLSLRECQMRTRYGGVLSSTFPSSSVLCHSSLEEPFATSTTCLSDLTHLIVQLPLDFLFRSVVVCAGNIW